MGVISSGLQTIGSMITTGMQNSANMRMADLQYQRDIDMWNRQNAYNDPSAQMARLKAAGLNPNMIYGSGGGFTPSAPAPKYNAPNIDYSNIKMPNLDILPTLSMWQDIKNKKVQNDLIKEQVKAIEQKRLNDGITNSILGVKYNSDMFKYGYMKESSPYQLDFLKLRNRQVSQNIENMLTMNAKLGEEIKMSRLRQAYQESLNKYAAFGQSLRSPNVYESLINKLFDLTGNDPKGIMTKAFKKSQTWDPKTLYNPFKPFKMFYELFE